MSMPILTVDGDPDDYLPAACGVPSCVPSMHLPAREWLAIETLPEWVENAQEAVAHYERTRSTEMIVANTRSLRAGDTVTLATEPGEVYVQQKHRTFATATVAEVLPVVDARTWTEDPYVAVVLDVDGKAYYFGPDDADGEQVSGEPIDLPGAKPGHWAVRIEDVEAL